MVDELTPATTVTTTTPAAEAVPITASVTPVVTSVEAVTTPPVVAETPVVTTVVPVATTVAPPVVEVVKPPETVLAEAIDKTKVTTPPVAEAIKTEEVKPKEGETKSDEPAPAPVYDTFTLPEGITLDPERVSKFTEILSELEVKSKADHALVQEFGQKAVDFHVSEIQKAVENVTKLYSTTWDRQKTEWKDNFLKDPELGGNRFQTTVDAALSFIRTHGGTAEQQTEFRNLMETSGLGNHLAMIRLLANAGRAMSEGKPLAASKPVSEPKSKTQTLYGRSA